uniref:Uncharacterized protein n=1 Tax=Cacopsylla melanoneura TaxID=428564 RepID=A0A8D8YXS1_9HEMI
MNARVTVFKSNFLVQFFKFVCKNKPSSVHFIITYYYCQRLSHVECTGSHLLILLLISLVPFYYVLKCVICMNSSSWGKFFYSPNSTPLNNRLLYLFLSQSHCNFYLLSLSI